MKRPTDYSSKIPRIRLTDKKPLIGFNIFFPFTEYITLHFLKECSFIRKINARIGYQIRRNGSGREDGNPTY